MIGSCPVCASADALALADLGRLPVFANVQWPTPDSARSAPREPMQLAMCRECSMIWNRAFDPDAVSYTPGYENSLFFSPLFGVHANALVARLARRARPGGLVVDVGCGDGEFLTRLCRAADARGLGLDPSAPDDVVALDGRVSIERRTLDARDAALGSDLVCLRHVLEHVADPSSLLVDVGRVVRPGGVVYVEVPNAATMLEDRRVWDVVYEHVTYFSTRSLTAALSAAGLGSHSIFDAFGGQYLCAEASRDGPGCPAAAATGDARLEGAARAFCEAGPALVGAWRRRVQQAADRPWVLWGAGSKGVTFLNLVDPEGEIMAAVDSNPRKHGRFVAGTGHPILSPAAAARLRPGVVLVANPLYTDEVRAQLDSFGVAPRIVCL